MNIRLIVVGKTNMAFVQEGLSQYLSRLKHYVPMTYDEIAVPHDRKGGTPAATREREAEYILKRIEGADRTVLLDEHGREYSSVGFSEYLQKQMNAGIRNLAFVVGGAYGFAPEVYAAATDKLSLSQMTFNHQMVRLFFAEQLYRAFTIINNEPYHNE